MRRFVAVLLVCFASVAMAEDASTTVKGDDAGKPATASAKDDGYKCERVKKVGTNIPERVCTTAAQRALAREYALKELNRSQIQTRR